MCACVHVWTISNAQLPYMSLTMVSTVHKQIPETLSCCTEIMYLLINSSCLPSPQASGTHQTNFCFYDCNFNVYTLGRLSHGLPALRRSMEKLWISCLIWGDSLLMATLMSRPCWGLRRMLKSKGSLGTSLSAAMMKKESSSVIWPSHTWAGAKQQSQQCETDLFSISFQKLLRTKIHPTYMTMSYFKFSMTFSDTGF